MKKNIDDKGREILDPTPLAVSVRLKRPPTLAEQVKMLLSQEAFRRRLHEEGVETFEESDDFDCDEDFDPRHPWERNFDHVDEESPAERQLKNTPPKKQAASPPSPVAQAESLDEEAGVTPAEEKK